MCGREIFEIKFKVNLWDVQKNYLKLDLTLLRVIFNSLSEHRNMKWNIAKAMITVKKLTSDTHKNVSGN